MTARECVRLKGLAFLNRRSYDARHSELVAGDFGEPLDALRQRMIDQALAIVQQHVKEERRQRQLVAQFLYVDAASKAAHGVLKRKRPPVRRQRDHFAVENYLATAQLLHGCDDFRNGIGDLVEASRVDRDLVVAPIHLNPRAIELPLDRERSTLAERLFDV